MKARIALVTAILAAILSGAVHAQAPDQADAADAQPPEEAGSPLPAILQAEADEDYAKQVELLKLLQISAEERLAADVPSGILAKVKGTFGGPEVPRSLRIEDIVVAAGAFAKEKKEPLVMVEGVQVPGDDGLIESLSTPKGEKGLRLEVRGGDGVSMPALPEEGDEPIPSPILVIGRVRVPEPTGDQQAPQPYIVATRIMRAPGSLALRRAVLYDVNGNYPAAVDAYEAFGKAKHYSGHQFAAQALYRAAVLAHEQLGDKKRAGKLYSDAWLRYVEQARKTGRPYYVWRESGDGVERLTVAEAVGAPMDAVNADHILYKVMDVFTTMCGGSAGWGVIALAVITRLLIVPLTQKQLRSTREMQALAPEIKKLQEKYKGDRQLQQKRIMALYKEHGVNPLGGCFPLLIQMPILIALYKGIRMYIYQFSGQEFLWVTSRIGWSGDDLAQPDLLLLVLYTISMIVFQKFTAKSTPATDPQQQQMQQTMTYMMPIMFFFFFQNFPAAFILYWAATNVIFTGHQYWFNLTYQRDKGSPMIALPSWGSRKSAQQDEGAAEAPANPKASEEAADDDSPTGTAGSSSEPSDGAAVSSSKRKRRRRRRPSRRKRRKPPAGDSGS